MQTKVKLANLKPSSDCSRQSGFTLLEILIALSISFVLILGVIQIYVNSSTSFRRADAMSRIQENGRYGLEFLGRYLRLAGYRQDATLSFEEAFIDVSNVVSGQGSSAVKQFPLAFSAGQVISGYESPTDAGDDAKIVAGTDAFSIRFAANQDGFIRDCYSAKKEFVSGTVAINTFYIGLNGEREKDSHGLYCESFILKEDGAIARSVATHPFVPDIEDMQIAYGIDANNDFLVDQYLSATDISNDGRWQSVISVRIHLVVRSTQDNIQSFPDKAMDFLGNFDSETNTNNQSTDDKDDHRLRRQFVTTISLRNKMI